MQGIRDRSRLVRTETGELGSAVAGSVSVQALLSIEATMAPEAEGRESGHV